MWRLQLFQVIGNSSQLFHVLRGSVRLDSGLKWNFFELCSVVINLFWKSCNIRYSWKTLWNKTCIYQISKWTQHNYIIDGGYFSSHCTVSFVAVMANHPTFSQKYLLMKILCILTCFWQLQTTKCSLYLYFRYNSGVTYLLSKLEADAYTLLVSNTVSTGNIGKTSTLVGEDTDLVVRLAKNSEKHISLFFFIPYRARISLSW